LNDGVKDLLLGETFPTGGEYIEYYLQPIIHTLQDSKNERLNVLLSQKVTAIGRR
jgi:hypothetical protein